ncbi:hypothetical protein SDRG_04005 [Saprolegnia diclina VS20]|uniref:Uncharacterized protein n=1 Tax=Saprolegnia diclina (strain VS20) TaxID=1156394 RepID=T0QJR3_SAPDV|nr:hypothetical protein SDRG_04005 [Saprolegnia diclina VS20]EQC38284.1 hypothetical protein SDRG_04005 [Saprolegnia diclina VS20]|eukprot:XP_008607876.1 hypothetical protein SDRG_04005 [Saprolegnia diclina VS20]
MPRSSIAAWPGIEQCVRPCDNYQDRVKLPLPVEVVQRHFDHLTHKVDLSSQPFNPPQNNSHSHVNDAKSARVFFVHMDVCTISPELNAMMTSMPPDNHGLFYSNEEISRPAS